MADLDRALSRLDGFINHEKWSAGVSAGRVDGLSLDGMRSLMSILGDPQHAYPVIHVTGTNGKGSVAAMATRLLSASGLSVGTYSSPHVERVNERICRDGVPIGDDELAEAIDGVLATESLWDSPPSWFELMTAVALDWFAHVAVDVAVVEVGLLGRYDATNVVDAEVAVLTNVGPDHTDFRDGWERAVAWEKAGIVTPGHDAVVGPLAPELRDIVAAERPGRLFAAGVDYEVLDDRVAVGGHAVSFTTPFGRHDDVVVPLRGAHQAMNAAIATTAVEALFDRRLGDDVVAEAFGGLHMVGRCEVVRTRPLVILDGAHNAAAAAALAETLEEEFAPVGSRVLVVGMLDGRRTVDVLAALGRARFDSVVCTTPPSPRALGAAALAQQARAAGLDPEVVEDPEVALRRVLRRVDEDDMVVVAGSFYLLSPARTVVDATLERD